MKIHNATFDLINNAIEQFNACLATSNRIPTFSFHENETTSSIVKVVHGDWNAFPFPNNGTRGVYFILGRERANPNKIGLYIGKASFGSTTSNRLYKHLYPSRVSEFFTIAGYNNEV
jgi:hypothetical protein